MGEERVRRTRVLVVENDTKMGQRIVCALRSCGYQAETVSDGVQAMARLQDGGFDAVVTDLHMTRVHGLDLPREVRRMEGFPPVAVYTGVLEPSPEASLHPHGVFCVQMKKGSIRDLLRSLDEACRAILTRGAHCACNPGLGP